MDLSLSGRLVEIRYKDVEMPTIDFIAMAKDTGYQGVELRTTQVHSDPDASANDQITDALKSQEMRLTRLLTHDVTEEKWDSFKRYVELAVKLNAESVGIWVKSVEWTQKACDLLAEYNLPLVLQTHAGGFIGTPEECLEFVKNVDRDHLMFMYDASHFYAAGKPYGPDVIEMFKDRIFCGGFQQYVADTDPDGKRRLVNVPWDLPVGVRFDVVIEGLKRIDYDGFITVIEPRKEGQDTRQKAAYFAEQIRKLL